MTRVVAYEPNAQNRPWAVEATEAGLAFRGDEQGSELEAKFELARLPQRVHLNDGMLFRGTLVVPIGGRRRLLQLTDDAVDALLQGLGRAAATAWIARARTRYFLLLGAFFLLSSIPVPANPEAGIEAIPADPLGVVLGFGLLILHTWARRAPTRGVLFADAVWLGILAATGAYDVLTGEAHPIWLLLSLALVPLALSALNSFNRLQRVFALPEGR